MLFGRTGERNLDHPDNWPIFEAAVFDRFPDLQVLLGHWGEVVLFYLDRIDGPLGMLAKLPHSFSHYVRQNTYITAGGVYSQR